jgi:hypothetical protein
MLGFLAVVLSILSVATFVGMGNEREDFSHWTKGGKVSRTLSFVVK